MKITKEYLRQVIKESLEEASITTRKATKDVVKHGQRRPGGAVGAHHLQSDYGKNKYKIKQLLSPQAGPGGRPTAAGFYVTRTRQGEAGAVAYGPFETNEEASEWAKQQAREEKRVSGNHRYDEEGEGAFRPGYDNNDQEQYDEFDE